jgi:hypothetical protein
MGFYLIMDDVTSLLQFAKFYCHSSFNLTYFATFCCRALESLQCLRALWDEISFLGDQVTGHSTAHFPIDSFS